MTGPARGEHRIELSCGHVFWCHSSFASFYWEMAEAARTVGGRCPICKEKQ